MARALWSLSAADTRRTGPGSCSSAATYASFRSRHGAFLPFLFGVPSVQPSTIP